ncbi:MAG: tRNA dihydrouridine synthase DusB [Pseudobdellovibrionaceae bacterium]
MHPLEALKQNPFVLAPMAGITDHAFRTFMKKRGASVVVTELVSASGIEYKSERTLKLMSFDNAQRPIGIQLFGEDPEILARGAQVAEAMGCDFVDLNFGCPVPKVVKKGAGSGMLRDLPLMERVLNTVVKSVKIPVTIKIRTGWDAHSLNAHEVCHVAYNEGITWVAIHGRTRAQAYSGRADWDYIAEIKSKARLPILGNGDILTPKQAVARMKESGCDGVLIGRGCLKNPHIFMDALSLWRGEALSQEFSRDYMGLFMDLSEAIVAHCDEHIAGIQLRKFAAWFSTGYPGASQFRKNLFQTKSNDELMELAMEFFKGIGTIEQEDTSHEEFLMGGHG